MNGVEIGEGRHVKFCWEGIQDFRKWGRARERDGAYKGKLEYPTRQKVEFLILINIFSKLNNY